MFTVNNDFWKDKSVFVTGASGFLGSWLVRSLVDAGAHVSALMRDTTPRSLLVQTGYHTKITRVNGQLEDYDLIVRTLAKYVVDTIFHLGAQPIVATAIESPRATFETNVRGTWNVLDAARVTGSVKCIVVASSVNAYGAQSELPYRETHDLKARYPYDVSKSATDMIARSYCAAYDLPVVVTRCTSLYGGGDFNFNRVVPGTIVRVLENIQPVIKNGGKYLRDFIYIEDAVEAYLALAEKINDPSVRGGAFNIGTGKPSSVLAAVEKILVLMKSSLHPKFLDDAFPQEIPDQYVNSNKAKEACGWEARTSLEEGLNKTIAWYRSNPYR